MTNRLARLARISMYLACGAFGTAVAVASLDTPSAALPPAGAAAFFYATVRLIAAMRVWYC